MMYQYLYLNAVGSIGKAQAEVGEWLKWADWRMSTLRNEHINMICLESCS